MKTVTISAKSAGKHSGDKKNLASDKIRKSILDFQKLIFKNRFTRTEGCFTVTKTVFRREMAKKSREKYFVSREINTAVMEIKKSLACFFTGIHENKYKLLNLINLDCRKPTLVFNC
jgi:hypothetical protein